MWKQIVCLEMDLDLGDFGNVPALVCAEVRWNRPEWFYCPQVTKFMGITAYIVPGASRELLEWYVHSDDATKDRFKDGFIDELLRQEERDLI